MTKSKPFTRHGYKKLASEFEHLSKVERPKIVRGVADAAAEGDRSENAEYIYGKKRLREIDKRLGYLSQLLKNATIISKDMVDTSKICFGCTVTVKNIDGKLSKYTIVGEGESDLASGRISYISPVAKALLGKQIGDIVEIDRPKDSVELEIIAIDAENNL